jgi:hypothetical protein
LIGSLAVTTPAHSCSTRNCGVIRRQAIPEGNGAAAGALFGRLMHHGDAIVIQGRPAHDRRLPGQPVHTNPRHAKVWIRLRSARFTVYRAKLVCELMPPSRVSPPSALPFKRSKALPNQRSVPQRRQARLGKPNGGRLLGRFFATTRAKLREISESPGVRYVVNLAGYPILRRVHEFRFASRSGQLIALRSQAGMTLLQKHPSSNPLNRPSPGKLGKSDKDTKVASG